MSDKLIGCVQHDCGDCKRREQEIAQLKTDHTRIIASWKAEEEQWRQMNDELRAKLAAEEKDAARYRWLRDSPNAYPLFFIAQRDPNNIVVQFKGDLADMNIDTVMKEQA